MDFLKRKVVSEVKQCIRLGKYKNERINLLTGEKEVFGDFFKSNLNSKNVESCRRNGVLRNEGLQRNNSKYF